MNQDPALARSANYGSETIDELIKEIKPDIYIGAEDIWGFNNFWTKKWWNKIHCAVWTTLDSEPILPLAVEAADKVKNYFVWASFAEREMKKLGKDHVKTLRGAIDTDFFFKATDSYRLNLRKKFKLSEEDFIIVFVFRNQLRKSVPNLLEGYKMFLEKNPNSKAKLLLHTSWSEGWDITRLIKEKKIPRENILTTYFCSNCNNYHVSPFFGESLDCPYCKSKETFSTTSVKSGVSENQLNEVYNLMDVYCHPFTSGGQEIPIQEAKLTELITLVTNYSCGEDCCTEESGGLPLDWSEYREPGTQFIKASTNPDSIFKQLDYVYKMSSEDKKSIGKKARDFVLSNYSINVIGPQIEQFLDNLPNIDWDYDFKEEERDPSYNPPEISSHSEWLIDIYKNILKVDLDESDPGHKHWMSQIKKGGKRDEILKYFKKVAQKENDNINTNDFSDMLGDEGFDNRIAIVCEGNAREAIIVNSFLSEIQKKYSEDKIYVITKPKYFSLLEDNPACFKTLPLLKEMESPYALEGRGDHEGYFKIAFYPSITTDKHPSFTHNGKD
jgi:glycosyltransferase involved in cell wall biosynthesis